MVTTIRPGDAAATPLSGEQCDPWPGYMINIVSGPRVSQWWGENIPWPSCYPVWVCPRQAVSQRACHATVMWTQVRECLPTQVSPVWPAATSTLSLSLFSSLLTMDTGLSFSPQLLVMVTCPGLSHHWSDLTSGQHHHCPGSHLFPSLELSAMIQSSRVTGNISSCW